MTLFILLSVDELDQCNQVVGKEDNHTIVHSRQSNVSTQVSMVQDGSKPKSYFPFKQGYLFVATLRVGSEGIQMTVDGKHVTSFSFREVSSLISPNITFRILQTISLHLCSTVLSALVRLWSPGLLMK